MVNDVSLYENNIAKYAAAIREFDESLKTLSLLRLVVFIATVILIVILANGRLFAPLLVVAVAGMAGFAALVKRYNSVEGLKREAVFLRTINEQEILRLDNNLSGFATGEEFTERGHPYAADLDIFGQHSVFQLLNRATTARGQALLAEWLRTPAATDVIGARQQAIQELSPKLPWRQHFQAAGMGFTHAANAFENLLVWAHKPLQLLPHRATYLAIIIPLSLLSTWAAVYFITEFLFAGNFMGMLPVAIVSLINGLVLRKVNPVAEEITAHVRESVKILLGYQLLISEIERENFQSEKLQRLRSVLRGNNASAAADIAYLRATLETFKLRGGRRMMNHFFYSIFNTLWFLDVYFILVVEKWKQKHSANLDTWASAVSEFEVLSSLAAFHYSNTTFAFPEIKEEPFVLRFKTLGHPLIDQKHRICNDFDLNGRGKIVMITGSNMGGKSTFLRAIGINVVLALMGAPCCATAGQVSNMKVFTSMRTQDNLEEGVSSFYAELKRIEQLLALIKGGEPICFLLDEMFKGTNSQDRYKGGVSLIRQLSHLNAFGMISTHDLELARLAGTRLKIANFSFNSRIMDGEMIFNYTLTPGICSDFNASELMKRSGIQILSDIDEITL